MPPLQGIKLGPFEMAVPAKWSGRFAGLLFVGAVGFGIFWGLDHLQSDMRRIAPGDLIQLEQAQRHLTESPESTLTVFDDARGSLTVRSYRSDGCLLVERRADGAPTSTRFVPDLRRESAGAFRPRVDPTPTSSAVSDPQWTLLASPAYAQGRCLTIEQHGQPAKTWSESLGGCQIRAWRQYQDSCAAWAIYDSCSSSWGAWSWSRCVH